MSRRGGGGRGRGGSKSNTATKELLKRSASEAGLDDRHVKVLSDITRPPLFPDFLWKSSGNYWNEEDEVDNSSNNINNSLGLQQQQLQPIKSEAPSPAITPRKLPAAMASTNDKQREMNRRFQNAPFYIRPSVLVDIVRYSDRVDRNKGTATTPDATVLTSIAIASSKGRGLNNAATAAAYKSYFPEELVVGEKRNARRPNERTAGRSTTRTSDTTTAHAVAMKLEKLDHQEEETGKGRTTSITSITSNDDELLLMPVPPLTTSKNTRKTGEADETVLDDDDDDNVDDDDDDDDNRHDTLEDNVEEELGEDYTTNYYASDDDNNNDDDGDGEPTF